MKQFAMGICLMLLGINTAFGLSLQEAKTTGLVGERNDGYVGYVVVPPQDDVKALVKLVNNKRRATFSDSAKRNSLKTEQVAKLFYQRALEATVTGNYYQDASGVWMKK